MLQSILIVIIVIGRSVKKLHSTKNNNPIISIVISVITHFTVLLSDSLFFDQNVCLVTNFNTFHGFFSKFLCFYEFKSYAAYASVN